MDAPHREQTPSHSDPRLARRSIRVLRGRCRLALGHPQSPQSDHQPKRSNHGTVSLPMELEPQWSQTHEIKKTPATRDLRPPSQRLSCIAWALAIQTAVLDLQLGSPPRTYSLGKSPLGNSRTKVSPSLTYPKRDRSNSSIASGSFFNALISATSSSFREVSR